MHSSVLTVLKLKITFVNILLYESSGFNQPVTNYKVVGLRNCEVQTHSNLNFVEHMRKTLLVLTEN